MGICQFSKPDKIKTTNASIIIKKDNVSTINSFKNLKKKSTVSLKIVEIKEEKELIHENFRIINKEKSEEDKNFILNALKKKILFRDNSLSEFEKICEKIFYAEIEKNEYLFRQNDEGNCFFIIKKGCFAVEIDKKENKRLMEGDCFGELALLYNSPRSASLKAITNCKVWVLERSVFKKVVKKVSRKEKYHNIKVINKLEIFNNLTEEQKCSLSENFIKRTYLEGDLIFSKGDPADCIYIIKKGIVSFYDENDKFVRDLEKMNYFGEKALYYDGYRELTSKAKETTECFLISKDIFFKIFGNDFNFIVTKNLQTWIINNDENLRNLTKLQIYRFIQRSIIFDKKNEDYIVYAKRGDPFLHIFLIIEGYFFYKGKTMTKGSILGLEYLDNYKKGTTVFEDTLILKNAYFSKIYIKDFFNIIESKNLETMIERNKSYEFQLKNFVLAENEKKYKLKDFVFLKKISNTQIGCVLLVTVKNSNKLFAFKFFQKNEIYKLKMKKRVLIEKEILKITNFPLLYKCYNVYQDEYGIYFLTNFVLGKNMFDIITEINTLDTDETEYYIGSILICLEYLHKNQIIYRNLEPTNIIVNQNGVISLVDFSTSKILDNKKNRTYTIIGTPHYMAPEYFNGKGYSFFVDLWAMGICMFEFLVGVLPFGEDEEDPFEIYNIILEKNYDFPEFMEKDEFYYSRDLINILLSRIPQQRLNGSFEALKMHPFFNHMNWDELATGNLAPPTLFQNIQINQQQMKILLDKNVRVQEYIDSKFTKKTFFCSKFEEFEKLFSNWRF